MNSRLSQNLQRVLDAAVADREAMGVNLLIEKDGQELFYGESGMADRENARPMRRDTILRLYSQTKPVTAAAAMILMERGVIDLCQAVSDFIPAFGRMTVWEDGKARPAVQPIRLIDLLHMTSGLCYPDGESGPGLAAGEVFAELDRRLHTQNPMTTLELCERLAACPLAFEPGSSYRYGTSADVLGAVIEIASGKKLSVFMEEEIFAPLGMKDTGFSVSPEKAPRFAAAYACVKEKDGTPGFALYEGENLGILRDMSLAPAYEAGGAGLRSTVDDYMKFARMLLAGGEADGVRILSGETVRFLTGGALMPKQQAAFDQMWGLGGFTYGNFMRVCRNPAQACLLTRPGEYGWDGWLGTYFGNYPNERISIVMGLQKTDCGTDKLIRKLRNVLLSGLYE